MRDRYLFSADRKVTEYRSLLEITPGRARLLTPSGAARQVRWVVSMALAIAYFAIWTYSFVPVLTVLSLAGITVVAAWVIVGGMWALLFVGGLLLFVWWDRRSLPTLADTPSQSMELVLLGARSFGTFQDVRARAPWGEEIHLVVDARAPVFWEAVRLLEGKSAAPG